MKITYESTNFEILKELGARIKRQRIASNLTQKQMSEMTGLSRTTISFLENGKEVSFSAFIDVMRALGITQRFDLLLEEETIRPSEFISKGHNRQRVRHRTDVVRESVWKWGDEI